MKNIALGKINLPLDDYASQGNGILGIRDSGKSYTATAIAERLMDAGIPIIAFDPIGIWRYLRVPGAGKGYRVVIAGGRHGDLPLTARGAQEIVRASMRAKVSLIVDLYDIRLSKADWREVVGSCIRTLLYENGDYGLRHIFVEEAAEFCPQVVGPDQGRVYAEVEKLARMGGNALLGYTLVNQRAEQINKAVLELCDCMILHRQKGRNSITALSKWLDIASTHESKTLISSLPGLDQGECWVWPSGAGAPVRTKIPVKNSFHPDRRARYASAVSTEKTEVDVSDFVTQMRSSLEALTKEAEANDPKVLRAEIAKLKTDLAKSIGGRAHAEDIKASVDDAFREGRKEGWSAAKTQLYKAFKEAVQQAIEPLALATASINTSIAACDLLAYSETDEAKDITRKTENQIRRDLASPLNEWRARRNPARPTRPAPVNGNSSLAKVERTFLTVLAQQNRALTRNQVAIFAGYSAKSRHVDNVLASLRSNGHIVGGRESIDITDNGIRALGAYDPLPTGAELLAHWMNSLDKAASAFLGVVAGVYPKSISRDDLAVKANYSPTSRHVDNVLATLRSRDLVIGGRDAIRLSDNLT